MKKLRKFLLYSLAALLLLLFTGLIAAYGERVLFYLSNTTLKDLLGF